LPAATGEDIEGSVIRVLDVSHHDGVSYAAILAADERALRDAPGRPDRGLLRTCTVPGSVLLAGRYHVVPPDAPAEGAMSMQRRRTGGRAVAFGDGFLGLSLVLPHRAALVSEDWRALDPAQVMNRCVRGVLRGLAAVGVPAFYPGRDLITLDRRTLGLVSFETTTAGVLLFEAVIALTRDFSATVGLLDRLDPHGCITAPVLRAPEVTSVAAAARGSAATADLVAAIARGYAEAFALDLDAHGDAHGVAAQLEGERVSAWLRSRVPRAELDHRGTVPIQLGVLEAHFAVQGGRLGPVMLAGDFLASSAAVETLERRLVGTPADFASISARTFEAFAQPESFILGLTNLSAVAEAVSRGLGHGST
jgi:hypothetical protein